MNEINRFCGDFDDKYPLYKKTAFKNILVDLALTFIAKKLL